MAGKVPLDVDVDVGWNFENGKLHLRVQVYKLIAFCEKGEGKGRLT